MKLIIVILMLTAICSCANVDTKSNSKSLMTQQDSIEIINYQSGKILFTKNCAACHSLTKHVNPQMLINVEDRWKNKALLYDFIRNSQAVIAKDTYAKRMHENYNKTAMPNFPNLTDYQIEQMLFYVNVASNKRD